MHPSDSSELLVLVHPDRTMILKQFDSDSEIRSSLVIITLSIEMEIRGVSAYPPGRSRALSPASRRSYPDVLTFLCNNRLGDGFLYLRELCPLRLSDYLDSRNFSLREVRCSHQPVSSDCLIEINCCILLQSNGENFFTEDIILDAFPPFPVACRSSYPMPLVQALQEVLHNHFP